LVETDFVDALTLYLSRPGLLQPSPALVGIADPVQNSELPAVVVSLQNLVRLGSGLGERSTVITGGALSTQSRVDLANPVLPEDPSLNLLSGDRLQLTLFHGGLVRADGTTGPLSSADLVVTVAGANRPVVTGTPAGDQVTADPLIGRLVFATPLPASGLVTAQYFLGTWEQRVARMSGTLQVAVWGATPAAVTALSTSVVAALQATGPTAFQGVQELTLQELGTVASPSTTFPAGRARVIKFGFEFEAEVNVPESSGGLIQRIPIDASVA
jgi:hypothetical protein